MVDKYRWVDIGSSYLPSDILAAFLAGQLEEFKEIQRQRAWVWNHYHRELAAWAGEQGVMQPRVPADRQQPAHLYYLLMPNIDVRQAMLAHLRDRGVFATFHYQPLHSAPAGERYGRTGPGGCPVTDDIADRLLRLPVFAGMREDELDRVTSAVLSFQVRGRGGFSEPAA
jgi:dTDP-4-amino-4,6-dideoxygalactose transaminase